MNHAESFFAAAAKICHDISFASIEALASELDRLRDRKGRLFLLGVGGSAANCSHAVNDFRKLCGIETYSPVDNVSELTARTNDEGWDTVFAAWLEVSQLNEKDAILVMPNAISVQISSRRSISPRRVRRKCSGSWVATAAIPPNTGMWSS
jgi:D-sedoheptulose 7-phosphate isomerase